MKMDDILNTFHTVAMVGTSSNHERPSFNVFEYLIEHGYSVIPVNPNVEQIAGNKSYPDLSFVPESVEIVDIFRNSDQVLPIVEEAIKVGAQVVWMQEGVINDEAAEVAKDAGLQVVMDRCMMKQHKRLLHKRR
jgi:predicted CoA-binding protein